MATLSISGPGPIAEGSSGTTTFNFTVTRSGDASFASMVDYYLAPTSGGPGFADSSDFAAWPGGTLYFAAGETTKTVSLQVRGDTTLEPDEAFTIGLSNARGGDTPTGASASSTILNDDGDETPPVTALSWGTASTGVTREEGDEGATTFTYVLNRSGDTSGTTTVDWRVNFVGANRASADDFAGPTSGTVTFAPGELSKEIVVQVAGDLASEPDETFEVGIVNAPGAQFPNSPQTVPGRILNDDGVPTTPTFAISGPAPKAEGTGGTTAFEFTVTRSGDTSSLGMVDYWTVGDTNAADFSGATSGTVYFAAGETTKTVTLNVVGDSTQEGDESFFVGISNPRGGTITTAKATTTILNDDSDTPPMATLSWGTPQSGITRNEGDSGTTAFTYTVNRSGDTSGTTSVDWAVEMGTAGAADFDGATSGTITFAPGETAKSFTINVAGDTDPEADETFLVALSNSPGAQLPGKIGGKIANDDTGGPGPATVSVTGPGELEEGTGSNTMFDFTVTRTGDTSSWTMVDYWLVGDTNAADFTGRVTGTVYFAAGETSKVVQIQVVGDSTAEPDEGFTLGLSNVRGGVIGTGSAPARILDDDGWVTT